MGGIRGNMGKIFFNGIWGKQLLDIWHRLVFWHLLPSLPCLMFLSLNSFNSLNVSDTHSEEYGTAATDSPLIPHSSRSSVDRVPTCVPSLNIQLQTVSLLWSVEKASSYSGMPVLLVQQVKGLRKTGKVQSLILMVRCSKSYPLSQSYPCNCGSVWTGEENWEKGTSETQERFSIEHCPLNFWCCHCLELSSFSHYSALTLNYSWDPLQSVLSTCGRCFPTNVLSKS